MPFRPVNDEDPLRDLDRRMAGRGNGEKTARELDVDSSHLREIKAGKRRMGLKVARGLGWELRWMRVEKVEKVEEKNDRLR